MTALDRAWDTAAPPLAGPYVLYVGKLATNKGVQYLLPAMTTAAISWPLVVVGDGPLRATMEAEARASGRDVRFIGWRDREEVWAWMRHATLLAFPSYGPESLSRVLIEAAALGTPIAAMNTGGTPDIIQPRVTGLLSNGVDEFARDLASLAGDDAMRGRLGGAARRDVRTRFSAVSVVERVEAVYFDVIGRDAA
jgi:glycosyltransferase involved in cell wall biosynthesis